MNDARREQLEMAGYSWGRDGSINSAMRNYRPTEWTDADAAAFHKGFDSGRQFVVGSRIMKAHNAGRPISEAIDEVLGDGTHEKLASDLYDHFTKGTE
jgi:hypothetical protein